jgi:galactose mutarotase-like enzyme
MYTDQPAVQVYTSHWLDTKRKAVHGGPEKRYGRYSAIAIEHHGLVDAINHPEWAVDQICEHLVRSKRVFSFFTYDGLYLLL